MRHGLVSVFVHFCTPCNKKDSSFRTVFQRSYRRKQAPIPAAPCPALRFPRRSARLPLFKAELRQVFSSLILLQVFFILRAGFQYLHDFGPDLFLRLADAGENEQVCISHRKACGKRNRGQERCPCPLVRSANSIWSHRCRCSGPGSQVRFCCLSERRFPIRVCRSTNCSDLFRMQSTL